MNLESFARAVSAGTLAPTQPPTAGVLLSLHYTTKSRVPAPVSLPRLEHTLSDWRVTKRAVIVVLFDPHLGAIRQSRG